MKTRHVVAAAMLLALTQSDVYGISAPSSSDGPVKLLACVVSPSGILEASVDNQSDDAQFCQIHCNYQLSERTFSTFFEVSIPKRFQGKVGQFDTNNGKAGNYSGEISKCSKV